MAKNKKSTPVEPVHRTEQPVWQPDWRWHLNALKWIYAAVLLIFAGCYLLFKPYVRKLPPEITPWLEAGKK